MMREVLTRRFKRLMAEAPRVMDALAEPQAPGEGSLADFREETPDPAAFGGDSLPPEGRLRPSSTGYGETVESEDEDRETADSPWPDLVLIDGGLGQLNAARETLAALGVSGVPLIGIAKGPERDAGRETFFIPDRAPVKLKPRDPVLYFVQRLRDEAHRFAIGSHRQKRKKDIREAGLREIPGIGPARKRALLHHFGTLKAIERASVADLEHVPGINAETARKIYDFFHESTPRR